jgi:putative endonuclease
MYKSNSNTGRWGERAARRHLIAAGLLIVSSNWRAKRGEADIIAIDKRTLVVIEVKTRHTSLKQQYPAIRAVNNNKRHTLHTLVRSFMRNHAPLCRRYGVRSHRIDVIEIYYKRTILGLRALKELKWHRGVGAD